MLDTSVCIDVLRGRSPTLNLKFSANAGAMALSTMAAMELLYGVERSVRPSHASSEVADFMSQLAVLPFDVDAADHAARIRAALSKSGQSIGPYDLLIAAHARSRGFVVVTGNLKEFSRVEGLLHENWS